MKKGRRFLIGCAAAVLTFGVLTAIDASTNLTANVINKLQNNEDKLSVTPSALPTEALTATPIHTPTVTPTEAPTPTPTLTPTPTATSTPTRQRRSATASGPRAPAYARPTTGWSRTPSRRPRTRPRRPSATWA